MDAWYRWHTAAQLLLLMKSIWWSHHVWLCALTCLVIEEGKDTQAVESYTEIRAYAACAANRHQSIVYINLKINMNINLKG